MHCRELPMVSTFSIVARDPATGDLGIATQSKFLAVGAVVPWARAGVGAVATQARANVTYGPRGLDLLAAGRSVDDVVAALTGADDGHAHRQFGIVDAAGRAVTYTGDECIPWAGGVASDGFACQGNILVGPDVVDAMAHAYQTTSGAFADRLVAALAGGQVAGGDSRGQQSAALLVVRERGGYGGGSDRYIDLRVDDHVQPIEELGRLVALHRVYFSLDEATRVPLSVDRLVAITEQLQAAGYLDETLPADQSMVREALERFAGNENLEERLVEGDEIDTVILEFLRDRAIKARGTP